MLSLLSVRIKGTREQREQFCKDNKLNGFMESSAKTGINAQRIFIKAAETLYGENIKYQQSSNEADGEATQATPVNKANE